MLRSPAYIFFVDFEGHVEDAKVAKAIRALSDYCESVTVLGSFPMALASSAQITALFSREPAERGFAISGSRGARG